MSYWFANNKLEQTSWASEVYILYWTTWNHQIRMLNDCITDNNSIQQRFHFKKVILAERVEREWSLFGMEGLQSLSNEQNIAKCNKIRKQSRLWPSNNKGCRTEMSDLHRTSQRAITSGSGFRIAWKAQDGIHFFSSWPGMFYCMFAIHIFIWRNPQRGTFNMEFNFEVARIQSV